MEQSQDFQKRNLQLARERTILHVAGKDSKKRDDDSSYWKGVFHSTGKDLGVSGLRYASSPSEPILRRVIWVVLISVGLSFMLYQLYGCFKEYYDRPVSVTVDDIYPANVRFPVLTICNENAYSRTNLDALGLVNFYQILYPPYGSSPPWVNYTAMSSYFVSTLSNLGFTSYEEYYNNISMPLDEVLINCQFAGETCNATWFDLVWTDIGRCYQFNSERFDHQVVNGGSIYGLLLILNLHQEEYIKIADFSAGYRVLASEVGDFINFNADGIRVGPGTNTAIRIYEKQTLRLEPPYGNCTQSRQLRRFSKYSRYNCKTECVTDYFISECGCLTMALPRLTGEAVCGEVEVKQCIYPGYVSYVQKNLGAQCSCEPACSAKTYDLVDSASVQPDYFSTYISQNITVGQQSVSYIQKNYVSIVAYYNSLSYTRLESQVAYTTTNLFNDLGGALGLMLGSTFFTVYELIDIFIWAGVFRCKQKKKIQNAQQYEKHQNMDNGVTKVDI